MPCCPVFDVQISSDFGINAFQPGSPGYWGPNKAEAAGSEVSSTKQQFSIKVGLMVEWLNPPRRFQAGTHKARGSRPRRRLPCSTIRQGLGVSALH